MILPADSRRRWTLPLAISPSVADAQRRAGRRWTRYFTQARPAITIAATAASLPEAGMVFVNVLSAELQSRAVGKAGLKDYVVAAISRVSLGLSRHSYSTS